MGPAAVLTICLGTLIMQYYTCEQHLRNAEMTEDYSLADRVLKGDGRAETQLYQRYIARVRFVVSARVSDRADCMELVQDIMLSVIMNLRKGAFDKDRGGSLAGYVYGIARNQISQYLKGLYRRRAHEAEIRARMVIEFENSGKSEEYLSEDRRARWRTLISQLKPKYREVLFLRYYEALRVGEIARRLELSPQTVSDLLKYSKQLLLRSHKATGGK